MPSPSPQVFSDMSLRPIDLTITEWNDVRDSRSEAIKLAEYYGNLLNVTIHYQPHPIAQRILNAVIKELEERDIEYVLQRVTW